MAIMTKDVDKKQSKRFSEGNQKAIEVHKNAIMQLEQAIKHHLEAVSHLEKENHDEAHISTIKANGHTEHALDIQKEILTGNIADK